MGGNIVISSAQELPFLSALYAWGIAVIKNIQVMKNPALTSFMKIISSLGTEYFYIVVVLIVFWCYDEKRGFKLGLLIIISAWVNVFLKTLLGQPRPFNFEPALGLAFEPTNGFPSGHAQMSLTFWTACALLFAKDKTRTLFWSIAVLFILLIGFSRLYLGVHFPTDVFGGWIFACIIMALFLVIEKSAAPLLLKAGKRPQLILAAAAGLLMNALHRQDTSLSAMLLGFSIGYSLMIKHFPFSGRATFGSKMHMYGIYALRTVTGLAGFFIIYFGLKIILPGNDSFFKNMTFLVPYYELFRFIRYGLLGLWASAGAPKVFQNFSLTAANKE